MLERVASVVEPTLVETPPERPAPGRARRARTVPARPRAAAARPGDERGDRGADRRRAPDPRPLVRIRGTQRDARDRRDHRRVRRAVDAGHRVRALPSRDGRDQRQARRVGLRQGRHGRPDAGARQGGDRSGRRDPDRCRGREDPDQRRSRHRRRADQRRRVHGEDGREQRRLPAHVHPDARPRDLAGGFSRGDRTDRLLERVAEDQRRARRAAELHGVSGNDGRTAASRHGPPVPRPRLHRARLRRREVRPTVGRSRSSSARSRRRSTRRSRRPANT